MSFVAYTEESFAYTMKESDFFLALVDEVKREREMGLRSKDQLERSRFGKIISDYTGMNVVSVKDMGVKDNAAVFVPTVYTGSIDMVRSGLLSDFKGDLLKSFLRDVKKDADSLWSGSINLKEHKLSGFFTKLPVRFLFSAFDIYSAREVPPEEIAATILHEVGHVMFHFVCLVHTVTFSMMIQEVIESVENSDEEEIRVKFVELATGSNLPKDQIKRLMEAKQVEDSILILYENVIRDISSATGTQDKDATITESYADHYVSVHGAGKYLFDGLLRWAKKNKEVSNKRFSPVRETLDVVTATLLMSLLTLIFPAVTIASIPFRILIGFGLLSLVSVIDGNTEGIVYEDPIERLNRVKLSMMGELRQQGISKERRAELNQQLISVNQILSETFLYRNRFIERMNSLSKRNRLYKADQQQEQLLQRLARNNLIIASSKLKETLDS